jgi:hypothetical protein
MQTRAALRCLLLLGARGSASGARHFSQRSTAPPSLLRQHALPCVRLSIRVASMPLNTESQKQEAQASNNRPPAVRM